MPTNYAVGRHPHADERHRANPWRQRVAALLAYASFPRSGVGRQTVWEPQAPAWVCGLGFRRPHAQAGAWGSQSALRTKLGLEVHPMSSVGNLLPTWALRRT
ncbi:MAG: hypothetical protein WCI11_12410 [Candidatus Methylumidiphilus sp.]